jgi:hypothetical protein
VAGTSEAFGQAVAGLANDTGGDNVTGMTWGTDTIRVTATNVVAFVHGTHTAIGTAGDVNDGTVGSFLTNVGLIDFAQAASANAGNYTGTDDVAITFTTPSATMTEALFEAALQYVITGTGAVNTITGGALADTITGGAGADILSGGAGDDAIDVTAAGDIDTVVFSVGAATTLTAVSTANGLDTITGYAVADDLLNFAAIADVTKGTTADIGLNITATNAALAAADNVLIFNDGTAALMFANAAALGAATTAFTNITDGNVLIVYAAADDGVARVALATIATGDITAAVDIAILVGIDVDNVVVGMFTMA